MCWIMWTGRTLGAASRLQMVYAAAPWAMGPMAGVWLYHHWAPAAVSGGGRLCAASCWSAFWVLRLGNGKQITRAKRPAVNPLAYLGRFFSQPRLIAGWLFAVMRSCGWWVYVVYLPIFCIEAGLGDKVGGIALSVTNALLFAAPGAEPAGTPAVGAPVGARCLRPVRRAVLRGGASGFPALGRPWRWSWRRRSSWSCWMWWAACPS